MKKSRHYWVEVSLTEPVGFGRHWACVYVCVCMHTRVSNSLSISRRGIDCSKNIF